MNVLTVIDYLGSGGPSYVAIRTASALINAGHKVSFIVLYNDVSIAIDPAINVITLNLEATKSYRSKYTTYLHNYVHNLEKEEPFDLILVHLSHSIHLLKAYHHTHVYHYIHNTLSRESTDGYSFFKGQLKLFKLRLQHKNLNLIAVSKGVQDDATHVVKIKPKSIQTIYNPINMNAIQTLANKENTMDGKDYIIHIGRFVAQKRHDRLIKAYQKSGITAKLLLIGEGPLKGETEALVKTLKLTDKVLFHNPVQNPYPYIKSAKVLVLSSDYEGLGLVLLEALALGVPVISTDCPHGPKEIFENYNPENLVALDEDTLAQQIQKVYTTPELYKPDPSCLNPFSYQVIAKAFEKLAKT